MINPVKSFLTHGPLHTGFIAVATWRNEISLLVLKKYFTRREISYLGAAM